MCHSSLISLCTSLGVILSNKTISKKLWIFVKHEKKIMWNRYIFCDGSIIVHLIDSFFNEFVSVRIFPLFCKPITVKYRCNHIWCRRTEFIFGKSCTCWVLANAIYVILGCIISKLGNYTNYLKKYVFPSCLCYTKLNLMFCFYCVSSVTLLNFLLFWLEFVSYYLCVEGGGSKIYLIFKRFPNRGNPIAFSLIALIKFLFPIFQE